MRRRALIPALPLLVLLTPVRAGHQDPARTISPSGPLISFKRNGFTGYADATGRVVIEPRFALAFDFSEGLASIRADRSGYSFAGYINWASSPCGPTTADRL